MIADEVRQAPLATATPVKVSRPLRHAEFEVGYIWLALAIALLMGFAIGAHLTFVIAFNFPLGAGFLTFIQVHGHLQLMGWAGLFILGISLHFLPRLAAVSIPDSRRLEQILWLLVCGLLIRALAHSFLPYFEGRTLHTVLSWTVASTGVLELAAIGLYVATVFSIVRRAGAEKKRPALTQVAPFMMTMLAGWLIYALLNAGLLLHMAGVSRSTLEPAWNEFAVQSFIGLVLIPVAFAFSARMFPLYLRLPALDLSIRWIAFAYVAAILIQLIPTLPPVMALMPERSLQLSNIGMGLKGGVILWFVWRLDLLTRRRLPWTVNRVGEPGPERRPTRKGLPDYGEFGRFEWLVYASYAWLVFGAAMEIAAAATFLMGIPLIHSTDAVRHIYLLGFISHLIFGMSVRMIPGFLHKRQVAVPALVAVTFWLLMFAALGRIMPMLIPAFWPEMSGGWLDSMNVSFALSGIVAMFAVALLWYNLGKTAGQESP